MVVELKANVKYHEVFVPGKRDAIAVLKNFVQAGIFTNYVMYEGKNEVRIAGNELLHISVSQDRVFLSGLGKSYSEVVDDPFKSLESLLSSLPIDNWTAYGYVAFDVARFYSSYSKAMEQKLCNFLIPETELSFTEEGTYIKTTKPLEQVKKQLDDHQTQLSNYVPTSLNFDFSDRDDYKNRIKTLIEAIQRGELHKAIISRSVKVNGDLDVLGTYVLGAKNNNSVRSYCLNIGDVRAVGFSPEILMKVSEDGFVVVKYLNDNLFLLHNN